MQDDEEEKEIKKIDLHESGHYGDNSYVNPSMADFIDGGKPATKSEMTRI